MVCAQRRNVTDYVTQVMPEIEQINKKPEKIGKWLSYNLKLYPPTLPGEPDRPAYVCHEKKFLKYSPKKLWYIACFVRGMSIDEALKQLDFINRKGAAFVKETLLEAQELAVEKHNVEFKSNLWIAESNSFKGPVVKGLRRHARMRFGVVEYRYSNYYVRLEEGKPPENYYGRPSREREVLLNEWLDKIKSRKITHSL
ncbi:ribosomal protein, L22 [Nesidiocoris tenuis]|uniref:Large ribosomal subunit protein uL22m n=1 Tax=Nesidiocoris tenuis TaxID=355587 RepID=A0ABN7B8J3_9HEMI|nr:ribosomal protein, L22 [Nesidiocoris tenuis]